MKKKITDYLPDPHNANRHTERGAAMLSDSLQELGAGAALVVDKNGVVIAGNQRLETAPCTLR